MKVGFSSIRPVRRLSSDRLAAKLDESPFTNPHPENSSSTIANAERLDAGYPSSVARANFRFADQAGVINKRVVDRGLSAVAPHKPS
jgi:hypothetical protein